MVQRLHLCEKAVTYFGFQRLEALAEGDGSRESEARQEQAFMLGLARAWREDCQREADLDAITIEQQLTFARMQFDHLSLTGPAHKMRDLAQRLARLQQRILALEAAS